MQVHVTGLFLDEQGAADAVRALVDAHFEADEINLVTARECGAEEVPVERTTGVPVGAAAGGALGGALGAAGAALVAVGTLPALPVALFAAGPIFAALQGGALGAAAGGLLGSLAGLGFWQTDAQLEDQRRSGAALVGVRVEEGRVGTARAALVRAGARWLHVALAPADAARPDRGIS